MQRTAIGFLASAIVAAGSALYAHNTNAAPDIVELASGADQLSTLVTAVSTAELVGTLQGDGPFTVFAPVNSAFDKINAAPLLRANQRTRLTDILTYHVVPGRITAADLVTRRTLTTVNGERLAIQTAGAIKVGNAGIIKADIEASNGIVHLIDAVLIPASKNIPTLATEAGTFNTLVAAADAAGLVERLATADPITVFAPTDDAFARLPEGTVEALLRPENRETLTTILAYHVVEGRRYGTDLYTAGTVATLVQEPIEARLTSGGVKINDATVVSVDIDATNGVVHAIDSVLIPPSLAGSLGSLTNELESDMPTRDSILAAIELGVPLFNDGNQVACYAAYLATARTLVVTNPADLSDHGREVLIEAIRRAGRLHDKTEGAWVLRRGLDAVLAASRDGGNIQRTRID